MRCTEHHRTDLVAVAAMLKYIANLIFTKTPDLFVLTVFTHAMAEFVLDGHMILLSSLLVRLILQKV